LQGTAIDPLRLAILFAEELHCLAPLIQA